MHHWAHINRQKLQKVIKEHNQLIFEQLSTTKRKEEATKQTTQRK